MKFNNVEELVQLKKQFFSAMGYNSISDNYQEFNGEFYNWLKESQKLLGDYVYILDEIGFQYQDENTAEIGKSVYDSATIPFETKIITPYANRFLTSQTVVSDDRVYPGILKISEDEASIMLFQGFADSKDIKMPDVDKLRYIDTFMTHNPYSNSNVEGWHHMHNSGNHNIILGVHGHLYDKDLDSKIKLVKDVEQLLVPETYSVDYCTIADKYFYVLGSDAEDYKSRARVRVRN